MLKTLAPLAVLALLAVSCKTSEPATSAVKAGNATCPMSGHEVDPDTYVEYEGTKIYLCCDDCMGPASKDLAAAYAKAYPAK